MGLGLSPIAPGTLGSLLGLALAYPVQRLSAGGFIAAYVLEGFILVALGVISSNWICRRLQKEDPSEAVIDEVAAQFLVTALAPARPWHILASFLLFRFFDIAKIFPANRAERLPGGWGVMADDLVAAAYAAATYRILLLWIG
ncbi:MAG TPA: phosphatidylglycerophosphatase A [Acidobacteriota bacterium]|jgi:phosphatidylglycerophosphatase A